MLRTADQRVERLHRRMDFAARRADLALRPMDSTVRRADLAVPAGMFDFLDSKLFAATSVAAITAVLCYVSGVGGVLGLLVIPPVVALIYWLMFRPD
jgi:hypothetical protein